MTLKKKSGIIINIDIANMEVFMSDLQNDNKGTNEKNKSLAFWEVLTFVVLPTFIIQFILKSDYRLSYIIGGTIGASITTYIMTLLGFLFISKTTLTSKIRKIIAVLIGFVLYYGISFIVSLL